MEATGLNGGSSFNDEIALKGLLEAFGAAFSLEQIASAYCQAGKDADMAAEALALCEPNGEAKPKVEAEEESSKDKPLQANGYSKLKSFEADGHSMEKSLEANGNSKLKSFEANGDSKEKSLLENGNSKATKIKYRPVSVGSVSSIIGKHYVRKAPAANGSCDGNGTKPVKLDSTVFPMSEIWAEDAEFNSTRDDRLHEDMEAFLFSMLGDGFNLERERIREVLDSCGYDMEKSMEKLIGNSASPSDERNKLIIKSSDKSAGLCLKSELSSDRKCINFTEGALNTNREESGQQKERDDLPKEVLAALFGASQGPEELPRRTRKGVQRYGAYSQYGNLVVEPPKDFILECKSSVVYQQNHGEDVADDEDRYQGLRKAVKEYRNTEKEYYRAAVEAFAKADHDRAKKLVEKGKFFHEKARQADDESNEMIFKTRNAEAQDDVVLDLHERGAKEAIRLLKCQISSFCGISSIKYLKVIIDTTEEDISKGSRRRSLVLKLLEDESIKWEEGENAGTIRIQLDCIDRKDLTFIR